MPTRTAPFDESTAAAVLLSAGVPYRYPIRGCFFDERIQAFAENENCETVTELAATPLVTQVIAKEIDIPNFGIVSARTVLDFQEAVASGDRTKLRQYVPLPLKRAEIDLGFAAKRSAEESGLGFEGLVKRLVEGKTLEEVAKSKNLTRERVRQVEETFVNFLKIVLDGIPDERLKRWREWERDGTLGEVVSDESGEVVKLVQGALRHLFSRQPEADEIRANQFVLAEKAAAALAFVPKMYTEGANAREILKQQFPDLRWHRLLEWNAIHNSFVATTDCNSLRIPEPKARDVVAALLASGENRPREIIDFLFQVPGLWSWPPDSLANNCALWRTSGYFPATMLAEQKPDLAVRLRENEAVDVHGLVDFVRQTGPRPLVSSKGIKFTIESYRDGFIIVSSKGSGRRFDTKTLRVYLENYAQTKSKKTTAYRGGFHATYFIALVEAYENERPYVLEEIGAADIEVILKAKPTERAGLIQNRIGQGKFRYDLITNRKGCYITGITDPRFLRASHIKPWRDGDDAERLDWQNGLLLTPNLDLLFDRGLISFSDSGALLISPELPESIRKDFGLQEDFVGAPLSEKTRLFLAEHRTKSFRR